MVRQIIPKTIPTGPKPLTALQAVTWTAGDPANDERIVVTGKDIVVLWNTSADTGYDYTVLGVADGLGRSANIGPTELAFGTMVAFIPGFEGFAQSGTPRYIHIDVENAAIKYAVLTFP